MIVVLMSGEEFNTVQVELPSVSLGHYGMNTSCQASDPPGTDVCYGPSYWLYVDFLPLFFYSLSQT